MRKMKSAFEIAMEKAEAIGDELTAEEELRIKRDKIKPLLSDFYKEKISPEDLWERLKDEDDGDLLREAQVLLIESIGLKTADYQIKRRKEGILAIESLKEGRNSSLLEQGFEQVFNLKERYNAERERMNNIIEEQMENAQMTMKPVKTSDGRTVMKMEPAIDEETQQGFKEKLNELEMQSKQLLNQIADNIKEKL
ncbi:hypothetical protein GM661_17700 [Iocasia frigidifontis]|uniref:Uncharacterized protein n=1 Tax=Iocasia fonsfrigidae TaxID=2682810 RepID=A0A8A7KCZ1_9FIRM|nr:MULTISPECIES: hypothetical protein [Halanaerobiaceae]QTL99656.1 hypothetical protein GM661_17700 [Iocasia fonsfrigidae]